MGNKVLSALPIEWVVLATVAVHLALCPYTKVEESFNMQAVHDILYHSTDISQYDHLEFPGVVPRTFLGPLVLAALSAPLAAAGPLVASKFAIQSVVRMMLGSLSVCAFYRFRQSVESVFGRQVATWLVCVTVTQFHFMFYLTRTLPNMMAMPLVLLAFSFWMRQQHGPFIWCSAAAILIFRSELAALLGILLLMELCSRRLGILRCLKFCVPAGVCVLLLSVGVDSLFWRRLVWPEGEVLWFNVVLNKSAEWGTSPALWYWYSALPRALAASLPLVPVGLLADARCRPLAAPALAFVALYSLLPHKELRFIIYVVPLLNVAAARACHGM
ncbi:LOW QUALITY PROTEIN: probable Dol-P-Man:Man(7)GlcNAc(2)-PP-Dol alpha-1,6-mannosyltransferase [Pollicipes pollicipes]|uniref:LOW QUALITY PROTEIN: probable Dol-P-Man:Man(7)GlcNAc(2)-PP-Dol alpha-1,6-mannosyltransferase n=1 Tax=Pollicipes pollicipes TaxID=41117 RepID=UPI001884DC51|nr:LOW QUALITY PROTEIN: probable Dol-P-Man:Man(7)GlcNAc(2)-PP-Dol alpha-1,6-mannosyltransferase [Pollicipes pollicipes]